jgi:hypothetical protein
MKPNAQNACLISVQTKTASVICKSVTTAVLKQKPRATIITPAETMPAEIAKMAKNNAYPLIMAISSQYAKMVTGLPSRIAAAIAVNQIIHAVNALIRQNAA